MFKINMDLSSLISLGENFDQSIKKASEEMASTMALDAYKKIVTNVEGKLKSTSYQYLKALQIDKIGNNTWIIKLNEKDRWLDDGVESGEMITKLLKGKRSKVIPFQHNKGGTPTKAQSSLTAMLRDSMPKGVSLDKIETNKNGKPKTGLLHSFSVTDTSKGKVPVSSSGNSLLQNVRIYQTKVKDKSGKSSVQRGIFTFRTMSEGQKGSGKWVHPGIEPRNFMDQAFEELEQDWEQKYLPQLMSKIFSEI